MEKNISKEKTRKAKELKREARIALNGNFALMVSLGIILYVVEGSINSQITLLRVNSMGSSLLIGGIAATIALALTVVVLLVSYAVRIGMQYMSLKLAKKERITFEDSFFVFKNHPGTALLLAVLMGLLVLLGFVPYMICAAIGVACAIFMDSFAAFIVLLVIGAVSAIVISYYFLLKYDLVYFIYFENPTMPATEIMRTSARLMEGKKLRALRLGLSFMGIILLSLLTLGVAGLWVLPYQMVTFAEFYLDVTGRLKEKPDWRPYISYAG